MPKVLTTPITRRTRETTKEERTSKKRRHQLEAIRVAMQKIQQERALGIPPVRLSDPKIREAVEFMDKMREKTRGVKSNGVAIIRKMRGPIK